MLYMAVVCSADYCALQLQMERDPLGLYKGMSPSRWFSLFVRSSSQFNFPPSFLVSLTLFRALQNHLHLRRSPNILTMIQIIHHVHHQVPGRDNHNHDSPRWQAQSKSRGTLQEMVVGTYKSLNRDGIDRRLPSVSPPQPLSRHKGKRKTFHRISTCNRTYVGYPRLAQKEVSASTLNITDMRISNPTPSSFTLHQTQAIGSHSSFHPQIHSFEASVSLLGAAVPFSKVQVPAVKTSDGAVVEVDQVVQLNGSAFGDFARAFMMNEAVKLKVYGKPFLKQGALPKIEVEYDKVVGMRGAIVLRQFPWYIGY